MGNLCIYFLYIGCGWIFGVDRETHLPVPLSFNISLTTINLIFVVLKGKGIKSKMVNTFLTLINLSLIL